MEHHRFPRIPLGHRVLRLERQVAELTMKIEELRREREKDSKRLQYFEENLERTMNIVLSRVNDLVSKQDIKHDNKKTTRHNNKKLSTSNSGSCALLGTVSGLTPLNATETCATSSATNPSVSISSSSHSSTQQENGNSAIFEAVTLGDSERLKRCVSQGSSVHERNANGDTLLHIAAECGHLDTLQMLLHAEVNVDARGRYRRSPLHCAAAAGHSDVVTILLDAGAKIDLQEVEGFTALALSATAGHFDVVTTLLSAGSNLHLCDKQGRNPTMYAAKNGHRAVVEILAYKGASLTHRDRDGNSLLILAVYNNHCDIVRTLLDLGVSPDDENELGETALYCSVKRGYTSVTSCLIRAGASLTAGKENENIFMVAARAKNASLLGEMLRSGKKLQSGALEAALMVTESADVVWTLAECEQMSAGLWQRAGQEALRRAAETGLDEVLGALLNTGIDPNAEAYASDRRTPLRLAAENARAQCVQMLLARNARPLGSDRDLRTLLDAAKQGKIAVLQTLLDAGLCHNVDWLAENGDSALLAAARNGHSECVKVLLEVGACPLSGSLGEDILLEAARNGRALVLNALFAAGIPSVSVAASEALISATQLCYEECVAVLLEAGVPALESNLVNAMLWETTQNNCAEKLHRAGADFNAVDSAGKSALIFAAERGHTQVVKELRRLNASPLCGEETEKLLRSAISDGRHNAVEALLAGVDPEAKLTAGEPPLLQAAKAGYPKCVEVLLRYRCNPLSDELKNTAVECMRGAIYENNALTVLNVVTAFLKVGADPNAKYHNQQTALHFAAKVGNVRCIDILLENGANPHTEDCYKWTPLFWAAHHGHYQCVRKLLDVGSNSYHRDHKGYKPIDWTSRSDIKILLQ